jgi:hypothetical protein
MSSFMSIRFINYIYVQEKINNKKKQENKRMLINTNSMKEGTMQVPFVDVKSAPHAKHTASRISWLNTHGPSVTIRKRASQLYPKLTKDERG